MIKSAKAKVFNVLHSTNILLSLENKCHSLTLSSASDLVGLASNHEQAGSRLVLHSLQVLDTDTENVESVVILSHLRFNCLLFFLYNKRVFLDNGKADARVLMPLSTVDLPEEHRAAMLGFHTGNDYFSSFFGEGKITCWSRYLHWPMFAEYIRKLGDDLVLIDQIFDVLKEYECLLYHTKIKTVDLVRHTLLNIKKNDEEK